MVRRPVQVLVVEDSPVALQLLVSVLSAEPGITVAGTARNGEDAIESVLRLQPDVVTMDVVMPRMNGLDATRRLMEIRPVPIIIVSGTVNREEISTTFEALGAGAVAAIPRLAGPGHPEHERTVRELLRTVKLMAEVKVVRRWASPEGRTEVSAQTDHVAKLSGGVVAIGGSTGGTQALQKILTLLPPLFPLPILVVQHMSPGFVNGFAEWLNNVVPLEVRVARNGDLAAGGTVYIAPDQVHLGVGRDFRISLSQDSPDKGLRPSVAFLFRSVLAAFGRRCVAVLLSGMGDDGARELKALHDAGALTVAQDQASSIIFGMPGEAVRLQAARYCLPPDEIAALLERTAP